MTYIGYIWEYPPPAPSPPRLLVPDPGGVRTKTAMHYFDEFPTWRNFVVMRAVFRVSLIIVCTTFAGLFSATILDLESSGIVK